MVLLFLCPHSVSALPWISYHGDAFSTCYKMSLLSRVVKTLVSCFEAPGAFEVRPYPFLSSLHTKIPLAPVSGEGAGDRQEGRVYTAALPSFLGLELWQGIGHLWTEWCGPELCVQWTLLIAWTMGH